MGHILKNYNKMGKEDNSENVYLCKGESELPLMFFYHEKKIYWHKS